MGLRRSFRVFASLLALFGGCRKGAEAPPPPEPARTESASGAPESAYVVEAEALGRFIRYQERALEAHAQMLAALARAGQGGDDGGSAAALRQHAEALDAIRREERLSERDVEELEAIVGEVIAVRAAVPAAEAKQTVDELQELASRLPPDQRAEFDQTVDALKRQYAEASDLREVRERYGSQNVDRVLAREKELLDQWNRAVRLFAGEK